MREYLKNVYEIRKEKNGYVVLNSDGIKSVDCEDVAVICFLYYTDTLPNYLEYIERLDDDISIYIITSSHDVFAILAKRYGNIANIHIEIKENRGRDIAALLVTGNHIVSKYKYICFLHDKKPLSPDLKEDTDIWIQNLWDNTIPADGFVRNVKEYFESNPSCGLLVPPERFGEYFFDFMKSNWEKDYKITVDLAESLNLKADISEEYPPITLGTVFWARTEAIKKIYSYSWKNSDFPEEPFPDDGVISHAVERIFAYVAQDAGYDTYTLISTLFAPKLLSYIQDYTHKSSEIITQAIGGCTKHDIDNNLSLLKQVKQSTSKYLYLYGAGTEGKRCLRFLRNNEIEPDGFVVSKCSNDEMIDGLNVEQIENIVDLSTDILIIITVYDKWTKDMMRKKLEEMGIHNIVHWRA